MSRFAPGTKVRCDWWSPDHHVEVVADDGETIFGYDVATGYRRNPTFLRRRDGENLEVTP